MESDQFHGSGPAELADVLAQALAAVRDLQAENEQLQERIKVLERQSPALASRMSGTDPALPASSEVSANSPPDIKLRLFQSLFHGREDVYATRWEGRDGRTGYAPALRAGAPRGRRVKHEEDDYLPFTPGVLRSHLTGAATIGIYPLLRDETCWLLAIDFDKASWQEDVLAALDACDALGIPAALERSRSGQGAHLWMFFANPVAASLARSLGSLVLTEALDHRYQIGLDSYDRLFPSQGVSRRTGNTVFLDRALKPYPDQWRFLSSIRKLEPEEIESIVNQATRDVSVLPVGAAWFDPDADDQRQPWALPPSRRRAEAAIPGPLPTTVGMVLASRLFIDKHELPPLLINRLRRLAAFSNPEFYRAQSMRLSTFGKPRFIDCSEDFPEHLALPRGCLTEARKLLEANGVSVELKDERQSGATISAKFQGQLTARQLEAADALAKHDYGVLSAPTAFGKTVIGAWLIGRRGVSTLVLVHRQHLLDQWRERLAAFLDLPLTAIGQFGGGKRRPTGIIDVALLQSLARKGEVSDICRRIRAGDR